MDGIIRKIFNGVFADPFISKLTTIGLGLGAAAATIFFSPLGLLGGAGIGLAAFGAKMLGSAAYCNLSTKGREYRRLQRVIKTSDANYKFYDNMSKITEAKEQIALDAMIDATRSEYGYLKSLVNQSKQYKHEFRMIKAYNKLNEIQRQFIVNTFGEEASNNLQNYIAEVINNWYKECDKIEQPCNIKHVADVLELILKGKEDKINPNDSAFRELSGEDDEYDDDDLEEEYDDPEEEYDDPEEEYDDPEEEYDDPEKRGKNKHRYSKVDMSQLEDQFGVKFNEGKATDDDDEAEVADDADEEANLIIKSKDPDDGKTYYFVSLRNVLKTMTENDKTNRFYSGLSPHGPLDTKIFEATINKYFIESGVQNNDLLACIGMIGTAATWEILNQDELNQLNQLNEHHVSQETYFTQLVKMLSNHIDEEKGKGLYNTFIKCGVEYIKIGPDYMEFISQYYDELEKSKADSNREQEPEEEIIINDFLRNRNKDSNDAQQQ